VGKRTIAERRTWNRCEPGIENCKLLRQCRDDWQVVGIEVVHDSPRHFHILSLAVIALDEPVHRWNTSWRRIEIKNLMIDVRKVVLRIGIELSLIQRLRLDQHLIAVGVQIRFVAGQPLDRRVDLLQPPEHVVEGPVLHHQNNEVFEIVETSWRHRINYLVGSNRPHCDRTFRVEASDGTFG